MLNQLAQYVAEDRGRILAVEGLVYLALLAIAVYIVLRLVRRG